MRALVKQGHDVTLLAPDDYKYRELIKSIGVKHVPLNVERFFGPVADLKMLYTLWQFFKKQKPDIVHNFTIKPNIYGTLAARLAGVKKVVCTVTGLGELYIDNPNWKLWLMRGIASRLYGFAFRFCTRVSFQNDDDLRFFVEKGIVNAAKAVLIRSSGVDLIEFHPSVISAESQAWLRTELGIDEQTIVISMFARAHWAKGVKEFVEASKKLAVKEKKFVFILVGWLENSKMSVPKEYLISEQSLFFRWVGFQEDVRGYLAISDVVVLPSYYREGIPRSLIEAMAMGKPIITTDTVGCREIVDDGKNGYLISPRSIEALVVALDKLLDDPEKRKTFGLASLNKVKHEFSEEMVVQQTFDHLYS